MTKALVKNGRFSCFCLTKKKAVAVDIAEATDERRSISIARKHNDFEYDKPGNSRKHKRLPVHVA